MADEFVNTPAINHSWTVTENSLAENPLTDSSNTNNEPWSSSI